MTWRGTPCEARATFTKGKARPAETGTHFIRGSSAARSNIALVGAHSRTGASPVGTAGKIWKPNSWASTRGVARYYAVESVPPAVARTY
jgi:hypothetical protein